MRDRAYKLKVSLAQIERYVVSGPFSSYSLLLQLASGLLWGSKGVIERMMRIKLSVVICEAQAKVSLSLHFTHGLFLCPCFRLRRE